MLHFLFVFYVFINENNTKQHDFNTFRKLREGATTIVLWEKVIVKTGYRTGLMRVTADQEIERDSTEISSTPPAQVTF